MKIDSIVSQEDDLRTSLFTADQLDSYAKAIEAGNLLLQSQRINNALAGTLSKMISLLGSEMIPLAALEQDIAASGIEVEGIPSTTLVDILRVNGTVKSDVQALYALVLNKTGQNMFGEKLAA